ncbi:MAG: DUF2147 domain-containing protein [Alphaproteobacteria bacterium]|nr:DUF2147 domain-containing protein [Alphaproteobacteria bacterium]
MLRSLCLATCCLVILTGSVLAHSPFGNWSRGDGNARVRVDKCGSKICATNTWIRNPGQEQVGHVLVMDIKKKTNTTWKGTAYDPQRKISVSMELSVGEQSMTTSGCVFAGMLCHSTNWTRIK